MRNSATSSSLAAVQVFLAVMLASTSLLAVAWIGGYNGIGILPRLPQSLSLNEFNSVPNEAVVIHGEPGVATAAAGNAITGGIDGTLSQHDASQSPNVISPGDGTSEFYGNRAFLSFWAVTSLQHSAWVAVRVAPLVGGAVIWWALFLVVRDIRRGHGFTTKTARRIAGMGIVLGLGMPLVQVTRLLVARWLVESSTAAQIAEAAPVTVSLWPIAVGLVLMVVALAWREASTMRSELQGLV